MSIRTVGLLALALICFVAALASGIGRLRELRTLQFEDELMAGWFASRTEAHLLKFAALVERFALRGEPDAVAFHEQIDVFWLAVQRLVRERDGAAIGRNPELAPLARELEARLAELEPILLALAPGDVRSLALVQAGLQAMERPLRELVGRAYEQFLDAAASSTRLADGLRTSLIANLALTGASGSLLVLLVVGAVREARRSRTRAEHARSAAREAEDSLRALVDALPVAVIAVDPGGRILLLNKYASDLTGVAEAAAVGKCPEEAGMPGALLAASEEERDWFVETSLTLADGSRRDLLVTARRVLRPDGSIARTVHIALDVTERRAAEEWLRYLAEHDALTGLANRSRFTSELERALASPGARVALLLLDLDGFKEVNDGFGHPAGDRLLVAVAGRLQRALPSPFLLARLGGDEFAVLQAERGGSADVVGLAQNLIAVLAAPFAMPEGRVRVGASVGIAFGPEHGCTAAELLRHADIALYRAKARGRGVAELYTAELAALRAGRLRLATALEQAVRHSNLELFVQPVVRLADRCTVAFEALVRWPADRQGRRVPAQEIVSVAEEFGLIAPLTEWVLAAACRQARSWQTLGRPCPVAVNLSMAPAVLDRLESMIERALTASGLPAELLELEVTEGVLIRNFEETTAVLTRLRNRGIRIALDDFGTGYSALAYLGRFPLDKLKIDRRFTSDLGRGAEAVAIVDAIVRLGHALGLAVVAEGVERSDQATLLAEIGCDQAQGFFFGPPVPAELVIARAQSNRAVTAEAVSLPAHTMALAPDR